MEFDTYQAQALKTSGAHTHPFTGRVDWKAQIEMHEKTAINGKAFAWDVRALFVQARGEKRLMAAAMGLSGEAGEVTDYLKKVTAHGHPLDPGKVLDEVGDVLWYCAEVLSCCGLSLGDAARNNTNKLARRYGGGFSSEKSLNREHE